MRKSLAISTVTTALILLGGCSAPETSTATFSFNYPIISTTGTEIGTLTVTPIKDGGVRLDVSVSGLEPGIRAMHLHEIGSCVTPDFKSSGGHYNPANVAHGQHAGDMMNVDVSPDGTGKFTVKNMEVNLHNDGDLPVLMDRDGSALVIHGGADDYTSQPSGAAGPRVACAVIPAG